MDERHPAIVHWSEIEGDAPYQYDRHEERMAFNAPLGRHLGMRRIGIHHERVPAGHRLSFPHAESVEDEFVHVIEGTPDVWLDGHLHRLAPGDSVGFPAGEGLSHTFLNNTDAEVRLLVVGDRSTAENRIVYPRNTYMRPFRDDWWTDAPERPLGPHDGLTDARRAEVMKKA